LRARPYQREECFPAADTDSLEVLGLFGFAHGIDGLGVSAPCSTDVLGSLLIGLGTELLPKEGAQPEVVGEDLVEVVEVVLGVEVGHIRDHLSPFDIQTS
jgi:hypothetical protein